MGIRNKLYSHSFCFLCCITLEQLVNSVEEKELVKVIISLPSLGSKISIV